VVVALDHELVHRVVVVKFDEPESPFPAGGFVGHLFNLDHSPEFTKVLF